MGMKVGSVTQRLQDDAAVVTIHVSPPSMPTGATQQAAGSSKQPRGSMRLAGHP